ncbi:MAG TPA: hypothetical protein VGB14_12535 [Acidimicrobiales bacterium]
MSVLEATTRPAIAAMSLVQTLDFSMLRRKLEDPDEGLGVPSERLDVLEQEYRRFLALRLAYPAEEITPCRAVDQFWHAHILDTEAYASDCEQLFGRFVHHYPYFGMRGDDDARDLRDAFARTLELYVENFGEPPAGTWPVTTAAKCRTKCKPVKCK